MSDIETVTPEELLLMFARMFNKVDELESQEDVTPTIQQTPTSNDTPRESPERAVESAIGYGTLKGDINNAQLAETEMVQIQGQEVGEEQKVDMIAVTANEILANMIFQEFTK